MRAVWIAGCIVLAAGLLGAGVLVLAWRLAAAPLDVTGPVRTLIASERLPVTIEVGRVTIRWDGLHAGLGAPLVMDAERLRLGAPMGGLLARATVGLSVAALLRGRLAPIDISAKDGLVMLRRTADGRIALAPGLKLTGPSGRPESVRPGGRLAWRQLRSLRFAGIKVAFRDDVTDLAGHAEIDARAARDRVGAISGYLGAVVVSGAAIARLHARATPIARGQDGGTRIELVLSPLLPATLAALSPKLSAAAALRLPVGLTLDGSLDRRGTPVAATMVATAGAGAVDIGAFPVPVAAGVLTATIRPAPGVTLAHPTGMLVLDRLLLRLAGPGGRPGPTLTLAGGLSGNASRGGALSGALSLGLDAVPMAGLDRYWPDDVARGARVWLAENITAGMASDAAVTFDLASRDGIAGLMLARIGGGFDASGLIVHWLRPITPITDGVAHVDIQGTDALAVSVLSARQGKLRLDSSRIVFTGLTASDQVASIEAHLRGPLPDLLSVLAAPRLHLLSRQPLHFTDPAGRLDGHLSITLPLEARVSIAAVAIRAEAAFTGVHLGDVAAGRALDDASLSLRADNDGLTVAGTGMVSQVPVHLLLGMDFRAGPAAQITERATVAATAPGDVLARALGLSDGGAVTGLVATRASYQQARDGHAALGLDADLGATDIQSPVGWSKPSGSPGAIHASLGFKAGVLVSIDRLSAAAPGLLVSSHAAMERGRVRTLVLDAVQLDGTRASGRIELPAGPGAAVCVRLRGPVLDLSRVATSGRASGGKPPPTRAASPAGSGQRWSADLGFGRVLLERGRAFGGVAARFSGQGGTVLVGEASASSPSAMTASLGPAPLGRRFILHAGDAGGLLTGLGLTRNVAGGVIDAEGTIGPPGTIEGHAGVTGFSLQRVPWAARLLRDATVYGLADPQPSPGISVTRLSASFRLHHGVLTLSHARASQPALGITADGTFDLDAGTLDLRGTLVPAYALNALPGRLPVVGQLFSPERGGGLFAATWHVDGDVGAPSVRVNPVAALVPGVLRDLLKP